MHPPQLACWSHPLARCTQICERSLHRLGATCFPVPGGWYPYLDPPRTLTDNYTCLPGFCFCCILRSPDRCCSLVFPEKSTENASEE